MNNFFVYTHLSKDGDILYVGRTINLHKRTGQHFVHSSWSSEVDSIKINHCKTRAESISVERELIRSLKPKYNRDLKKLCTNEEVDKIHFVFTPNLFYDRVKKLLSLNSDLELSKVLQVTEHHVKMVRLGMLTSNSSEYGCASEIIGCASWELFTKTKGRYKEPKSI